MKTILSIGVLTLATLWLTPGTSSAGGTFGLFTQASCWPFNTLACWCCNPCCGKCCPKCCLPVCVRQYNAFSPTCCGTMYSDDICPLGGRGYGPPSLPYGALPPADACADGGTVSMTTPATPSPCDGQPTANPV